MKKVLKNAEVTIVERDLADNKDQVDVDVMIDKKEKVKEISNCATLYSCLALDEKSQKFYVQDKLKEYGVKVDFKH